MHYLLWNLLEERILCLFDSLPLFAQKDIIIIGYEPKSDMGPKIRYRERFCPQI